MKRCPLEKSGVAIAIAIAIAIVIAIAIAIKLFAIVNFFLGRVTLFILVIASVTQ